MTKGGRIFAAILAIIGAGIFMLGAVIYWFVISVTTTPGLVVTLTLITGVAALVLAFLMFFDKSWACIILLILGIFLFLQPILVDVLSVMDTIIEEYLWVDAALITFGGFLGAVVGGE